MQADGQLNRRDELAAAEVDKLVEARTRGLSDLSTHLQAFSEKEKWELARKLHDELGGLLTAAKMDLSWLQSRVEGAAIQERLSQLGGVLDQAMDLKRRVVEELRPSLLDHFGLPTALRAYVEATCSKAGLSCEVVIEHACESMPKDTAIALFRVVQEGLSNIVRHAGAKLVRFTLSGSDQHCTATLTDDGQGFDSNDPRLRWSHGIAGMRQRVAALGGRMQLESRTGRGATLRIEIPAAHSA
jgi:signal transduction histidine kinase